jgi:glycosyltransferase involved in cell wall biosynthesis
MKSNLITVVPVRNGEEFIEGTLASLARQTRRPDRVIVLDNCSTDGTPEIVRSFRHLAVEYVRNPVDLGLFGNCNRALDFAAETEYLHILHADDLIEPEFYEAMTSELEDCAGRGMAWCLDERIDEKNQRLSVSGKPNGKARVLAMDAFLRGKAEIANQAFSATLLKTNCQPAPCRFRTDFPILGDALYWAEYGTHCRKLVCVNQALAKYRWHGTNMTSSFTVSIDSLIVDEWRTMQINESLRHRAPGLLRRFKLRGLFAVRSGIKAKRLRGQNNHDYANQVAQAARKISGPLAWAMAQVLVEARDLLIYKLMGRPIHPKNIYG